MNFFSLEGLWVALALAAAQSLLPTCAIAGPQDAPSPDPSSWTDIWCLPWWGCGSTTFGGSGSDQPLPGSWTKSTYRSPEGLGQRDYYVYIPANRPQASANGALPLVLALHGCMEDVPTFAVETGLNQIAEKYGFVVAYPEESSDANSMLCWNWFDSGNSLRGSGEIAIAAGIVQEVSTQIQIDTNQVFAVGFSSGGAMASNLISCYSDIFAGGMIHSGLEFRAATTAGDSMTTMESGSSLSPSRSGALAAQCAGNAAKLETVMILHGDQDVVVDPVNSKQILEQFTRMNDGLDDGSVDGSQTTKILDSRRLNVPNGYPYRVDSYGGQGGIHIMNVTVEGMGHAWSGAHQASNYADPAGPDAGEMMWLFLSQATNRPGR
ncbi:MAG: PHB depolymerase family esterase [Oligoflexia bacterium]|nr:PHB depolymerase family esterase [Oligoflexia bacterium]